MASHLEQLPSSTSSTPPDSPASIPTPTSPIRTKRERQVSRNSRLSAFSDEIFECPSSPTVSLSNFNSPPPPTSHHDSNTFHHNRVSTNKSFLTLPLFIPKNSRSSSPPSPTSAQLTKSNSMRESASMLLGSSRDHVLPSHTSPSPRGRLFSTPGVSGSDSLPRRDGTSSPRRWSTVIPLNRGSNGFAHRLAEGASPYLRAGLDELRSIFDVDSDPIPISALDEDDSNTDEEKTREQRKREVSIDLGSPSTFQHKQQTPPKSPIDRSMSLDEGSPETGLGLYRQSSSSSLKGQSIPNPNERLEKVALRAEDGTASDGSFSAANLGINRGILAWSLALIAIGLTSLCAYGYAIQSDTFSTTLIVFFLTQPGFSLMGLVALILRRRALMDLFSRAMRAHVLAQACIVLLAYLDLSASSFYVGHSNSSGGRKRIPFQMVPTMEMRYGPSRGAIEAGDTPGINLLYSSTSRGGADNLILSDSSSFHSRDTHVGDFQSRLIHLIVFVVQAALPILAALIGQYIIAQRLAWLARRTTIASRQNSLNYKDKMAKFSPPTLTEQESSTTTTSARRYESKTLPPSSTFSAESLSLRLNSEINILPMGGSSRGTRRSKHSRSLSQPLHLLHNASLERTSLDGNNSVLSIPLSESPPNQD